MPRVSLGLPVYNGENFVVQAIRSILDLDFEDFELVISDNASVDRTEEICREFAAQDDRIRYYRNDCNTGAGANFNRAFELTSGALFKWCSHDDVISRNFLKEAVRALDENPDAVIAYPKLVGIDQHGALTSYQERPLPEMAGWSADRRFRILLSAHGCDAAMFGLWRRDALARTSLHEPYYGSDCALLAEMAILGQFIRVPNAILYSRDHPRRSVNLASAERLSWQNPNNDTGRNALELSSRLKHLVVVAYRRRREAPIRKLLFQILAWISNPILMGRLALEGVGVLSPSLRGRLRGAGLAMLRGKENVSNRVTERNTG